MKCSLSYAIEQTLKLLDIHSPSGYTQDATDYVFNTLAEMGYAPSRTRKGAVLCTLGGEGSPLVLAAHVDTLGLMVKQIKSNGRLAFTRIGGLCFQSSEAENVTVITRDNRRYTGVIMHTNPSKHVNSEVEKDPRNESTLEILLDENAFTKEEVEALGVSVGDLVCLDPRPRVTESGFIRSRFLDDKLSAGMLLALAKAVKEGSVKLPRKTSLFFSVYEEVGHGASHGLPEDTEDLLVIDMGCVGDEISCTELQVSICAKDRNGPYDYSMTGELIALAKENSLDYAVDCYPFYGSDAGTAVRAGFDVRYALIGAGVYASHGYERSHLKGVENTMRLIEAYVEKE